MASSNNVFIYCFLFQIFRFGLFFFFSSFLFRSTFDCLFSPKQHDIRVGNHRGGKKRQSTSIRNCRVAADDLRASRPASLPSDQRFQARHEKQLPAVSKIFFFFFLFFFFSFFIFPPDLGARRDGEIKYEEEIQIINDVPIS